LPNYGTSPDYDTTSLTFRGLQVGDIVTLYAKDGLFTVDPSRNFEGFVPAPGPYHLAGTATYELPPVITDVAGCGSVHSQHTKITGMPGVGTSFLAISWGHGASVGGKLQGEPVGGKAFTAISPFAEEYDTLANEYICEGVEVAGIRYESDPEGTVQVTEFEPMDSNPELEALSVGHGGSDIIHNYGAGPELQGSRLIGGGVSFFCGVKQQSDCRVKATAILPGGKPVVVGHSVGVVLHPGAYYQAEKLIKLTGAGTRELRARVPPYRRCVSPTGVCPGGLKLLFVTRLTGAGRKPVLKRIAMKVEKFPH
jgi:hypothetical protein